MYMPACICIFFCCIFAVGFNSARIGQAQNAINMNSAGIGHNANAVNALGVEASKGRVCLWRVRSVMSTKMR